MYHLKPLPMYHKQEQAEEYYKSNTFSTNFLENFKLVYSRKNSKIIVYKF